MDPSISSPSQEGATPPPACLLSSSLPPPPPSYLGYYPTGAFIVKGPRALGPLVKHLRDTNRLKSGGGENVTPFLASAHPSPVVEASSPIVGLLDGWHAVEGGAKVDDAEEDSSSPDSVKKNTISNFTIFVDEGVSPPLTPTTTNTADDVDSSVSSSLSSPSSSSSIVGYKVSVLTTQKASLMAEWRGGSGSSSSNSGSSNSGSSSAAEAVCNNNSAKKSKEDQYFAVHAVGQWSDEVLANGPFYLGSIGGGVVAFVHQLRSLSAACHAMQSSSSPAAPTAIPKNPSPAMIRRHHYELLRGERKKKCLQALLCQDDGAAPVDAGKQKMKDEEVKSNDPAASSSSSSSSSSRAPEASFSFSELFGGIGMFRLGLEAAGGKASFAVEWATPARLVYEFNYGHTTDPFNLATASSPSSSSVSVSSLSPLACDLTEIPTACFPPHDLLTAGFPCQSFAKAGQQQGLHNTKGWLFYEVVRVLLGSRPKAFLLENVANLVDVEEGEQLAEILKCLRNPSSSCVGSAEDLSQMVMPATRKGEKKGDRSVPLTAGRGMIPLSYTVSYRVIDGGLATPQTRKRVYFIGVRNETDALSPPLLSSKIDAVFEAVVSSHIGAVVARHPPFNTYKCVADLLEEKGKAKEEENTDDSNTRTSSSSSALVLSDAQWESVRRSKTFRQDPRWRVADLCGHARTVLGSYRTSYQLYSEFVPTQNGSSSSSSSSPSFDVASFSESLRQYIYTTTNTTSSSTAERHEQHGEEERMGGKGDGGASGGEKKAEGQSDTATSVASPPPLRFYSLREVARLQGIPDAYRFGTPAGNNFVIPEGAMYKLVGNAVNPLVIEALGRGIVEGGLLAL